MGDWSLLVDAGQRFEAAADTAASGGVVVTSSASANTKGAWTELIAATASDAAGLLVTLQQATVDNGSLYDIGIGTAGAEQVLIPDLLFSRGQGAATHTATVFIPVAVPVGARIAARAQSTGTSIASRVGLQAISGGLAPTGPLNVVTAYGITSTGASTGVTLDPGGTAHTKGSYTEIVASTTRPMEYMILAFSPRGRTIATAAVFLVDIAIGGSGSETVVIPNLFVRQDNSADYPMPGLVGLPCTIPAGTRIAARCQSSTNTATNRNLDIAVYGVD